MLPENNITIPLVANVLGQNIYDLATLRKSANNNWWGFKNWGIDKNWGIKIIAPPFRLGDYRGYDHFRRAIAFGDISLHGEEQREIRVSFITFPEWSKKPTYDITYTFAVYYSPMGDFQHMSSPSETIKMVQSAGSDTLNFPIYITRSTFSIGDEGGIGYVYVKLLSSSEDRRFDNNMSVVDGFDAITPQGVDMESGYIMPATFKFIDNGGGVIGMSTQLINSSGTVYPVGILVDRYLGGMYLDVQNRAGKDVIMQYEVEARTTDGSIIISDSISFTSIAGTSTHEPLQLRGAISHLSDATILQVFQRINLGEWVYKWDTEYSKVIEEN
jgi:hypothetical protein